MSKIHTHQTLQDFVLQGLIVNKTKTGLNFSVQVKYIHTELPIIPITHITQDFVFQTAQKHKHHLSRGDSVDFSFARRQKSEGQTIFTAGFSTGDVSSNLKIENWQHHITPTSFNSLSLGNQHKLENHNIWLYPNSQYSGDMLVIGLATIHNVSHSIIPQSWSSHAFGTVHVSPRFVFAKSTDHAIFGQPIIFNKNQDINVLGFNSSRVAQPTVQNRNQHIYTGNIYPPESGKPIVDFYTRKIQQHNHSTDSLVFGTTWLSHHRRRLHQRGTDSLNMGQNAWISWGTRHIMPTPINAPEIRQPSLVYPRYIRPESWDNNVFGTRIIPERQLIQFEQGTTIHSLQFGEQRIFNRKQIIKPFAFETRDRFGWAYFWNKKQYIYPIHDDLGGTTPPPLTHHRTHIHNRNRVIGAIGITPPHILEPLIYHNARVILPNELDSLNFGKNMIAFKIRHIQPENWDSLVMTRWGVVYNDARVIAPKSITAPSVAQPEIFNTRRQFRWISAGEQTQWGKPMVDFAIRHIAPYHGIKPDYVPMPTVHLHTRHVHAKGSDMSRFGNAILGIRWNKILPRWTHRDHIGTAQIRNLTPELYLKGRDMVEIGTPTVQLHTRYITPDGDTHSALGKPHIGDRNKSLLVNGIQLLNFGKHHIWHLTTPVNYSRVIYPASVPFGLPENWFGRPMVRDNIIRPNGISATGHVSRQHKVWSNTIRVDLGIGTDGVGNPKLELSRRSINLHEHGIQSSSQVSKPRLSPYTIWARHDTPLQAISNHDNSWQDVDAWKWSASYSDKGQFGKPNIIQAHDIVIKPNHLNSLRFGTHQIELSKREIQVKSFNPFRMGWVIVGDGSQEIVQFKSPDFVGIGAHKISFPNEINKRIYEYGFDNQVFGRTQIELHNRTIYPKAWDSQIFGYSRNGENGYMPQSLCVYFPKPIIPESLDGMGFGETRISLFNRSIVPVGWDSFVSEYDYRQFKARMRVQRGAKATPATQIIQTHGQNHLNFGYADISNKTRFIRPDGFMDNYRKGVHYV